MLPEDMAYTIMIAWYSNDTWIKKSGGLTCRYHYLKKHFK